MCSYENKLFQETKLFIAKNGLVKSRFTCNIVKQANFKAINGQIKA